MEQQYPVYTIQNECQDCYKCVRHCPVKAIKIENGHAMVLPQLCVACGTCVQVCPARAKQVRRDVQRARHLLKTKTVKIVSLAPSWVTEFEGIAPTVIIQALKQLGFDRVSETALGAQQVSAELAQEYSDNPALGLQLSSACPAAVEVVRKYFPEYTARLSKLFSPLLAHCRMLRQKLGNEIGIVFIGPCIAKKLEADRHPELLDLALTFQELREWLREEKIDFENMDTDEPGETFFPEQAAEGALYPMDGGMIRTLQMYPGLENIQTMPLTGVKQIKESLETLDPEDCHQQPVFVECLACEGGCLGGPAMSRRQGAGLHGRMVLTKQCVLGPSPAQRNTALALHTQYHRDRIENSTPDEAQIRQALAKVGKYKTEDELNCGGCGYETCRNFALALLSGKAEPAMCVSFLRNLASKKANALLRSMPSAAVIVDADLRIIECNESFARLFGEEGLLAYQASPGLAGARLEKIVPFADLFQAALRTGKDLHREHYPAGGRLFDLTIFAIESGQAVGAVIQDVTQMELRRDQIAQRAREVISRNLKTVQEIACRLGENMADTEILLRSIAEGYSADEQADTALQEVTR